MGHHCTVWGANTLEWWMIIQICMRWIEHSIWKRRSILPVTSTVRTPSANIRHFASHTLAFFVASDSIVNKNLTGILCQGAVLLRRSDCSEEHPQAWSPSSCAVILCSVLTTCYESLAPTNYRVANYFEQMEMISVQGKILQEESMRVRHGQCREKHVQVGVQPGLWLLSCFTSLQVYGEDWELSKWVELLVCYFNEGI